MDAAALDVSARTVWDPVVPSSGSSAAVDGVAQMPPGATGISVEMIEDTGELVGVMCAVDVSIDEPKDVGLCEMTAFSRILECDDAFALSDEEIRGAVGEASALLKMSSGASVTGQVLFDVYTLMALMIDCSQKMRDAAREIRQAENTEVQLTIQFQADKQRTAAIGGMIASVAVCALQVAAQSANMVYMAKGAGNVTVETKARMVGDMIAAIGNVAQGIVKSSVDIVQADATEEGAKQQQSQEMLDQAKDLFSQCQSVVEAVVHLMQSVLQAELQSMRDVIHA